MPTAEKLLTEEVRGAEGIVRVLEDAGIDMVFGIAGGNMGRLYDALYDHQNSIRAVLVRHEQLASVMAEVYGRLTGKPGVCTGQGIFMLANGLLGTIEAHFAASPMLLLTDFSDIAPFTQHATYQGGTGAYGSVDTKQALSGVTKYVATASDPLQAAHATQLAIKHALSGERGPVAVLYHSSALNGPIDPNQRPFVYPTKHHFPAASSAHPADIEAVAHALNAAERPVIIAGNGVRVSKGYEQLAELAALVGAPVTTTAAGKGVYAETGDWALGVCGNFGQATANAVVGGADVILAVGTRLGPADTANENPALIDPTRQTILQIDIEPKNASWAFPCETVLVGDAGPTLAQVADAVRVSGAPSPDTITARRQVLDAARAEHKFFGSPHYTSDDTPMQPQRVFAELLKATDKDAMFTCDAGENRIFMAHHFRTKAPGTLLMSGSGGMGYAIPAALASKLVFPDRQVIAVSGDGGFGMSMTGIMTARDEHIPIVSVVLNNSALGWVKHGQGNRTIASTFSDMNFANVAKAMGVNGIRVEDPADLAAALKEALTSGQPTVVDVVTSFDQSFRDVTSPLAAG